MVFGLALSIGAFSLINGIATNTHAVIYDIITFAFSFLILIYIWFRYSAILEIVKVETRFEADLNMLLLFLVIIEPYLFYLLRTGASDLLGFTSVLFAMDIAGTMFVLGAFYTIGIKDHKEANRETLRRYAYARNGLFATAIIFMVSALPMFSIEMRYVVWIVSLGVGLMFRRFRIFRKLGQRAIR